MAFGMELIGAPQMSNYLQAGASGGTLDPGGGPTVKRMIERAWIGRRLTAMGKCRMKNVGGLIGRRECLKRVAAIVAAAIVPSWGLGGEQPSPPSERITIGLIGHGCMGLVTCGGWSATPPSRSWRCATLTACGAKTLSVAWTKPTQAG